MAALKNKSRIDEYKEIARITLETPLPELVEMSASCRDAGYGTVITYSRKVFIPLTRLCRDVCHYCTFAKSPEHGANAYLTPEQVLEIAMLGKDLGCKEALFTLGDKPELRYEIAKNSLRGSGYTTTVEYLYHVSKLVIENTGLLPHINCGILDRNEMMLLRTVSPSMGLMLESSSRRLCMPGGPHFGSPDKDPEIRMGCIRLAGELKIPFTTGILIGIGETRSERLESLLELANIHDEYGHIQEVIIQNFVPKPGTKMFSAPPVPIEEILWTAAAARLIFGPKMSIQVPPNLNVGRLYDLISAGINDWGGLSPVTPDHVNPESPWPHIQDLADNMMSVGKILVERLTVYPGYIIQGDQWIDPALKRLVLQLADSDGLARENNWVAGLSQQAPQHATANRLFTNTNLAKTLNTLINGKSIQIEEIVQLFRARGEEVAQICNAADILRKEVCGDIVTFAVNRNINYTNVCKYKCGFCAFSKGKKHESLRGEPYLVDLDEIVRRAKEAWEHGATEVCMQGGIHPKFTGQTYLDICREVKKAVPQIHVHAFSPLEVSHGANSLGISIVDFLQELKNAGLGSLPGTAAEILDDSVRAIICPDKINTQQWLNVIESAHSIGLPTTATIMFGHLENIQSWAIHLLSIKELQQRTGQITEFVPLPFIHMEAPLYLKGMTRPGPTFREVLLMHAVSRLVLYPHINNIQVSWTKLGIDGAKKCLQAGANDLGGTLINESISRAAGASHGQCLSPDSMKNVIRSIDRIPQQRSTLYNPISSFDVEVNFDKKPITPVINQPAIGFGKSK